MKKSESFKEISIALSKLGAELGNVEKNKKNPFFASKYADLASILNYVKPALAEHGLSIIQSSRPGENNNLIVETLLLHNSGEWIETEVELPGEAQKKYNPQTVGSAYTYGRRYGLSAALNISSEEDTDGNSTPPKNSEKEPVKPKGDIEEIKKHISNAKTKEELRLTHSDVKELSWTKDEVDKIKYYIAEKVDSFDDNSDLTNAADRVKELMEGEVVK